MKFKHAQNIKLKEPLKFKGFWNFCNALIKANLNFKYLIFIPRKFNDLCNFYKNFSFLHHEHPNNYGLDFTDLMSLIIS